MYVASLELCKELSELSGWYDTEFCYYSNGGVVNCEIVHHRKMVFDKPGNVPAYELGYLLRKLPRHTPIDSLPRRGFKSYSPEDAAARLCIELIKRGIINKKEDHETE